MNGQQGGDDELHDFLDGLDGRQAGQLADILDGGPPVRDRLKQFVGQKLLLHRLGRALEAAPGDGRTDDLAGQLARKLDRRRRLVPAMAAGVAGCLLVAGLAHLALRSAEAKPGYYGFESPSAEIVLEQQEGQDFELAAGDPSEVRAKLANWAGGPVPVPELASFGLKLKHAKLLRSGAVRYLGLSYDGAGGELVLCVSPDADGLKEGPRFINAVGRQVGYWSDGVRAYALIGQRDQARLQPLIEAIDRSAAGPPTAAASSPG